MKEEEITEKKTTEPKKDVVKEEQKGAKKPNILNAVLTVVLILILLPVLGLLIFRFNAPNQSGDPVIKECKCEKCEKTECPVSKGEECNCPKSQTTLINGGWMKHISPDVKINLETPSYSGRQDIGGEKIMYTWDVKIWKDDYSEYQLFDNYIKTVSAHYYPLSIPEGHGCGAGCLRENMIDIHVFKNPSNLTLEQARNRYVDKLDKEMGSIKGEIKNKWGEKTYQFEKSGPVGTILGNIVVKNGNIYEVTYLLAGEGESLNIANKVLDSIRFN